MRTSIYDEAPQILKEFLGYMETVKGKSEHTVEEYYLDLRTFFRYIKQSEHLVSEQTEFQDITISDVNIELIRTITLTKVYEYMNFLRTDRQNKAASRSRKVSSLRTFFKYLTNKVNKLEVNPIEELETPKNKKALPKYLTLEQSLELLSKVEGPTAERDYCILTLFLNCGLRLSELVGLNLTDVYEDRIRVVGKGNKERIVYMGSSCKRAIDDYLSERNKICLSDNRALFGSRDGNRISVSAVHRLVKKHLLAAGLDATQFSAHKLRHTAATLMLSGGVDVKTLQEVLGHEHLNTTQIYTHIENTELKIAAEANPLSKIPQKGRNPSENS